jgi:tetrahydromethanopterin S-methyltransferase subunit F
VCFMFDSSPVVASANAAPPWSSLGTLRPTLVQPAQWGSPIAAQPLSPAFATCSTNGIEISSGSGPAVLVPDTAVGRLLKEKHYGLPISPSSAKVQPPQCEQVALDPRFPKTIYAAFQASPAGSIPPVYSVALVTTNLGVTWHFVPPPRGESPLNFAGFVVQRSGVQMMYSRGYFFPMKPGGSTTLMAASSSDGGRSWSQGTLSCATASPCLTFGPQSPQGACGMSEWQQSLLVGSVSASTSNGPTQWSPAGSTPSVNQCGHQQLIATKSGIELLVDQLRSHALLVTRDGRLWSPIALPRIGGQPVGGGFAGVNQLFTVTASGVLIAVSGAPFSAPQRLEVLLPHSTKWCAAKATLPSLTVTDPVSFIQSSASQIVAWFSTSFKVRAHRTSYISYSLAGLSCRN